MLGMFGNSKEAHVCEWNELVVSWKEAKLEGRVEDRGGMEQVSR